MTKPNGWTVEDSAYWYEQAELAVSYSMSRPAGSSKEWESAMSDATKFKARAALSAVDGGV